MDMLVMALTPVHSNLIYRYVFLGLLHVVSHNTFELILPSCCVKVRLYDLCFKLYAPFCFVCPVTIAKPYDSLQRHRQIGSGSKMSTPLCIAITAN